MEHLHLFIKHVAHQAQTVFRVSIKHLTVNLILIDALRQQFAYDEINLSVIRVICKASGVCHHTSIDAFGSFVGDVFKITKTADYTKHQLRG